MAIIADDDISEALQTVIDPEVGLDIWTMGLVYAVGRAEDGSIDITMTLTTRGCPMGDYITSGVREALGALEGCKEVRLELVFEPPWSPDMIDPMAALY